MFAVKHLGVLRPCKQSEDAFSKLPIDTPLQIEVKRPRNLAALRMYWGLVTEVTKSLPENSTYKTKDHVDEAIKIATGHYDLMRTKDDVGTVFDHYKTKSIAFHKMKEDDFSEFLDRAVTFICGHVVPGLDSDRLKRRVGEICNG